MMTKSPTYFYDSYAIIEFINQNNHNFDIYFSNNCGVTTISNLMEVYYSILKEGGEIQAEKTLELLEPFVLNPTLDDVKESMKFKLKNKKVRFSYTDCLGYAIARRMKIKFLTGDKEFKHLENVEFVSAN